MSPDTLLRNTHVDTLQAAPQVPSNMLTVHLPLALHARTHTHVHVHVPGSVQRRTAPFRFTASGIMRRIMRNIHRAADLSEFDLYVLGIFLGVCHALFGFGYRGDNNLEKKIE